MYLYRNILSFHLVNYLRDESHDRWLDFEEIVKLFTKMILPFFLFSWVVHESSSSSTSSPTWVWSVFLIVATLMSVYWCLIMVRCLIMYVLLYQTYLCVISELKTSSMQRLWAWIQLPMGTQCCQGIYSLYWKLPTSHTLHSVTDLFTPPFLLSPKWENAILIVLLCSVPYMHFHITTYRSTPPF